MCHQVIPSVWVVGPADRLGHRTHLGRQARLIRLGPRAHLNCLGCRAYSTRLCRQVGPIRLDHLANRTCHGCRVCRVCLGLNPECEVE